MERLTVKRDKPSINSQYAKKEKVWTADCIEKLGKYEDAEEQGLLLWLPCKVGDTVYVVEEWLDSGEMRVIEYTFDGIESGGYRLMYEGNKEDVDVFPVDDLGRVIFLSEAEAQETLERIEGTK